MFDAVPLMPTPHKELHKELHPCCWSDTYGLASLWMLEAKHRIPWHGQRLVSEFAVPIFWTIELPGGTKLLHT
jgi:hypothetical protein